jgi:Putative transposase/Transposase zinc-binding domain
MAVTLQQILQASFATYAQGHKLPRRVWKAAPAVTTCRTATLGGHVRRCPQGHGTEIYYNSCRHRACPRCCGQRRSQWLDHWQQQVLPTDHFHVLFPLPRELHALWQWNRAALTELLFTSVHETLATLLGDPKWLGAQPGILATLHTWGRTLTLHPHVHCLVSGGGLTLDGQWCAVRRGDLLPVAVVRALFRGTGLGAIEQLWLTGQLQVPPPLADDGVRPVLVEAARQKWNLRLTERYPHGRGVTKYLARYVRGGPIKDHRLLGVDGKQVTFRYGNHRQLDTQGKPQQQELTLTVDEFLRRWREHVPLPGVHMVRAWGAVCEHATAQVGALSRATVGAGCAPSQAERGGERASPRPCPPLGAVSGLSAANGHHPRVTARGRTATSGVVARGGLRGQFKSP